MSPRAIYKYLTPHHSRILTINAMEFIQIFYINISNMLFYPTIGSKYFVKTQTYVALFGPHELSLIFSGGMCLELTSL